MSDVTRSILAGFIAVLICTAVPVRSNPVAPETLLHRGIERFRERAPAGPKPRVDTPTLRRARDYFQRAFEAASDPPVHPRAGGYLLLATYLQARYGTESQSRKRGLYRRGKRLGIRLMEQYPDSVPIVYGTAAHLARWATFEGMLTAAREGVAGHLRRLAKQLIELDRDFDGGAGYRLLARVHHKTPYVPFLMPWPSETRARELMRKALAIAPDHPPNNLIYGNFLLAGGSVARACSYWRTAAGLPPRESRPLVDRYVNQKAADNIRHHCRSAADPGEVRGRREDPERVGDATP